MDPGNDAPPPGGAFAKLWGKREGEVFIKYVTKLPAKLGRASMTEVEEEGFIDLGQSKALSRHHATIDWDDEHKGYRITCHGRNGMVVGGKWHAKDGSEMLYSRVAIKLGPCMVYFLPAQDEGNPPGAAPNRSPLAAMGSNGRIA